ncbi:MAG: hypothetical protein ACRDQ4_21945 [Pseudonocardiaceae bacterium]
MSTGAVAGSAAGGSSAVEVGPAEIGPAGGGAPHPASTAAARAVTAIQRRFTRRVSPSCIRRWPPDAAIRYRGAGSWGGRVAADDAFAADVAAAGEALVERDTDPWRD